MKACEKRWRVKKIGRDSNEIARKKIGDNKEEREKKCDAEITG